jgi:hypothetical protein
LNNKLYAFISGYKSPKINPNDYLDSLYDFLLTRDMALPLFIIGDLNMDLLVEQKSSKLLNFMDTLNLKNFINNSTRDSATKSSISGELRFSNTLIDLVLHNNELISGTHVIDHSVSDHKIVLSFCKTPVRVVSKAKSNK